MPTCLNCGAALQGPFCGQCGQRVIPAYPSLREMAADAWHEFSGWDGRFARTFRTLLRPGALTIDVLEGRRARYVSPLRVYLAASVLYFLVAAAVPNLTQPNFVLTAGESIDLTAPLPSEKRAEILARLDTKAPWWANALIRPMVLDPQRVIARFREMFPRVLFVLVPVFAAIVATFYRRRPFSQHLVFGLHLHAATFLLLAVAHLGNLMKHRAVAGVLAAVTMTALAIYGLKAFRRVYREARTSVVLKSVGIGVAYLVALQVALLTTYAWAVLT